MAQVAPNVTPQFQTLNVPYDPRIGRQRNLNMMQQPRFTMLAPAINFAPFRVDMRSVGYLDEPKILAAVPTMAPIKSQTQSTTKETFNAMNLEPRTLMNHAQAPYGNARGQLSMITNVELNRPGKPLPVNNDKVFKDVAFDMRIQPVRPSKV
jgi:hypothetical protein